MWNYIKALRKISELKEGAVITQKSGKRVRLMVRLNRTAILDLAFQIFNELVSFLFDFQNTHDESVIEFL